MPTAVLTKRKQVSESMVIPAGTGVDRTGRVIRGVKVLGLVSGNSARTIGVDSDANYRYTIAALKEARPLYENLAVFIDHPDFDYLPSGERVASGSDRKLRDKFGRLQNVRVEKTGLFADLHYIESHPLCEQILEMAENMPELLALSHHAYTFPEIVDGEVLITRIEEVESVDLIGEKPGTTKSLFESEGKPNMADLLNKEEEPATAEMENEIAGAPAGSIPKEEEPATAEMDVAGNAVSNAYDKKCLELFQTISDPGELGRAVAALKKASTVSMEALGDPEKEKEPATAETEDDPEKKKDPATSESEDDPEKKKDPATSEAESDSENKEPATTESIRKIIRQEIREVVKSTELGVANRYIQENNELRKSDQARLALESAGVAPTEEFVAAVCAIDDKKIRATLIESLPKNGGINMGVRSAGPIIPSRATLESQKNGKESKAPTGAKQFLGDTTPEQFANSIKNSSY